MAVITLHIYRYIHVTKICGGQKHTFVCRSDTSHIRTWIKKKYSRMMSVNEENSCEK